LRIADLAIASGTTESWVTRVLRLAFLDPIIVRKAAYTRDLRARYAPGRLSAD